MHLHEYFKKYRQRAKLPAKRMSQLLKISYGYYTRLEKPFEEGKALPSEDLIRRFLEYTVPTPEEREQALKEMLDARIRLILPPELYTKHTSTTSEIRDPMPESFLHRLRHDIESIGMSTFCKRTEVPESFVKEVLEGKRALSKDMVVKFAKALDKSVVEYLTLADYLTDNLKSLLGPEDNISVLTRMLEKIPTEKISQFIETLETLISLYKKSER